MSPFANGTAPRHPYIHPAVMAAPGESDKKVVPEIAADDFGHVPLKSLSRCLSARWAGPPCLPVTAKAHVPANLEKQATTQCR